MRKAVTGLADTPLLIQHAGQAIEVQTANLGDILASPAGMFVAFKEGIRSGVIALETFEFGCGALSRERGVSNKSAALLPRD